MNGSQSGNGTQSEGKSQPLLRGIYRLVNDSDSMFLQDTYYFRRNTSCSFKVCMMKDTRKVVYEQTVQIELGAPPKTTSM